MSAKQKLKVLQVLGGLWSGGTEAFVMNMYRSIDREKVEFEFLIHEKNKAHYDDEVMSLGGKIHRIPDRHEVGTIRYIINLVRKLREIKPDVVHSHAMFNSGIVMFFAFLAKIKIRIAHSHNTSDQATQSILRKLFQSIMRVFINTFATQLVACSNKAAEYLFCFKKKNKQALILNNAVRINEFIFNEEIRNQIRRDIGIEDKFVIGHVGRFTEQKNHHFLIEIFKSIKEQYPNTVLLLVGEGPLKSEIESKVKELNLTGSVKFLGVRKDIPKLLQGFDLFLLPSLFEGLPFVLIEAQAAGLCCVLSSTVTEETDITGRVKFVDLDDSIEVWTHHIMNASIGHIDTSEMIRKSGYDTESMAKKLMEIYENKAG